MQPYMLLSLLPFLIIFESERLASHFSQFIELEYYEVLVLWIKVSIGAFLGMLVSFKKLYLVTYFFQHFSWKFQNFLFFPKLLR